MNFDPNERERELAEAVREACLKAALKAYEDASIRGLCEESAWGMCRRSLAITRAGYRY